MNTPATLALTDGEDRLIRADEALAELQDRCGGEYPGKLAIPELLSLVRKARTFRLRLARNFTAFDGDGLVTAFAEVEPVETDSGSGCAISVKNWQKVEGADDEPSDGGALSDEIDRSVAEFTARLDRDQRILAASSDAEDLQHLMTRIEEGFGQRWTEFVDLRGLSHKQPLHWRLLDGVHCTIEESDREWTVRLLPTETGKGDIGSFELLFLADRPLLQKQVDDKSTSPAISALLGSELTPALRQPIARIIANAETIKARLAGPISADYSAYAADIAAAGQHLLALLDDLSDLEVVEAEGFTTSPDRIDLVDVAVRAAGILGVKARAKNIAIEVPEAGISAPAIGEFRRVLQVLLNLIGNAINYSPEGSNISISVETAEGSSRISVCDQGPGLSEEQQARVFEKFERLGRDGDGGSGLGLYISSRLADAMDGLLSVKSVEGEGACFTLELPASE